MIRRTAFGFFLLTIFLSSFSNAGIVVAVIDTGADITHPALGRQLWVNPGETGKDGTGNPKESNGIDDDSNGYVDDVNGWNFANNTNDVMDTHGHGTHIAGIITKTAPEASVMILKYFNPTAGGEENQRNTVLAIEYAIQMNARIINYSAGGTDPSTAEEKVIKKAAEKNIVFVAAAGNERSNSDFAGFFPANYDLPNIISVTAVDAEKSILPSSNFGRKSVDIAAPGKSIVSSIPGGKLAAMTGTSQATAFVSSAVAVILKANPSLQTPEALRSYLLATALPTSKLASKTRSGAVIDIQRSEIMKSADQSAFGDNLQNLATLSDYASLREIDMGFPFQTTGANLENNFSKP